MTHYYFNFRSPWTLVLDESGLDLLDLHDAREMALASVREDCRNGRSGVMIVREFFKTVPGWLNPTETPLFLYPVAVAAAAIVTACAETYMQPKSYVPCRTSFRFLSASSEISRGSLRKYDETISPI